MTAAALPAAPPEPPLLLREDRDGVAVLTLNRAGARNALSMGLMAALQGELDAVAGDARVRAVILRGAGPAFCAGHDLREMRAAHGEAVEAVFRACSRLMIAITRLPQPVIAAVHGTATAAGCQLVATCDLAVAAEDARFATPGVQIGLFCSTPMVALSRAVPRKAALEMLLLGEPIDAGEARRIGLVNRVVPAAELEEAAHALARRIAEKPRRVVAVGKEAFWRQGGLGLEEAYAYTAGVMARNMTMDEAAEGIDAFLQKRSPRWNT
ncbi:enoyl-CoA hydratase [Methylobacterium oxalidis]|uniref:Enoyl-CoA hydratase domain-containing protein 3, mitochondrial n=1 Tax=Methylobacterium oxalidis TaxID=944322 RepID=A0A512J0M4_9HYPH|nr:enoyl-CoA hydratase [Methylobacterium oxalidis]GEP03504.1 enoyl-CoA hydratase [Methylobacterium oxalidis]GJE30088.1 Enoyl-CoA-hydratase [Methylobacterium oxalidis]GLS66576.1 enoyl-CoA hydratase [Methylobacterium oxalidis]